MPAIRIEEDYEAFESALAPLEDAEPLLWSCRDTVFCTLSGFSLGQLARRHRCGSLLFWMRSVLGAVWERRPPTLARGDIKRGGLHAVLLKGAAHEETMIPVLQQIPAAIQRLHSLLGKSGNLRAQFPEAEIAELGYGCQDVSILGSLHALAWARIKTVHLRRLLRPTRFAALPMSAWWLVVEALVDFRAWLAYWPTRLQGAESLLITSEIPPVAKAAAIAARRFDIPVWHIQHGLRLPFYHVTAASDFVAMTRPDAEWFQKRVPDSCRVHQFWHPRLRALTEALSAPHLDERPLRLLFLSQPAEGGYLLAHKKTDLMLLRGLAGLPVELRVRAHPRERAEDLMALLPSPDVTASLSTGSLLEDFEWAHVCASAWSTSMLEAAAARRGVLWVSGSRYDSEAARELRVLGIGRLVTTETELRNAVQEIVEGNLAPDISPPAATLRTIGVLGAAVDWRSHLIPTEYGAET